jgi:hypothetical protein
MFNPRDVQPQLNLDSATGTNYQSNQPQCPGPGGILSIHRTRDVATGSMAGCGWSKHFDSYLCEVDSITLTCSQMIRWQLSLRIPEPTNRWQPLNQPTSHHAKHTAQDRGVVTIDVTHLHPTRRHTGRCRSIGSKASRSDRTTVTVNGSELRVKALSSKARTHHR